MPIESTRVTLTHYLKSLVRRASYAGCVGALAAAAAAAAPCGGQPAPARALAPVAGTYELFVCKRACRPGDSARAVALGRLVLQDSPIPLAPRPDSAEQYLEWGRWDDLPPNGCYIFDRRVEQAETYAGVRPVGVVSWSVRARRDSAIALSLYRSPDAGHDVTLGRADSGGVMRGTGRSWGAGVAAVDWPDDAVVARRVGPPDAAPCFAAAAAEQRRTRLLGAEMAEMMRKSDSVLRACAALPPPGVEARVDSAGAVQRAGCAAGPAPWGFWVSGFQSTDSGYVIALRPLYRASFGDETQRGRTVSPVVTVFVDRFGSATVRSRSR